MSNAEILIYQQGSDASLLPDGYDTITSPLHPAQRTVNRLGHFSDEVYDLSPESHLVKLLKVLLGDAGVGQLHKRMLLARLQSILNGTHFFDLDAFYGAVLGVNRLAAERLPVDPFRDLPTGEEWDQSLIRDASYRSRIEQFAKALSMGATSAAMEVAAEALLGIDVDVQENWSVDDTTTRTWAEVSTLADDLGTGVWSDLDGYTWGELRRGGSSRPVRDRHQITIIPRRPVSAEEEYDLLRVMERIRPAGSLVHVDSAPPEVWLPVPVTGVRADSELWIVKSLIANSAIHDVWVFGTEANGWIEKPTTPWSQYQGEAWSYLPDSPQVVSFTATFPLTMDSRYDVTAQDLPSERTVKGSDTLVFLPQYALRPIHTINSGRSVSDGVMSAHPYSGVRDYQRLPPTENPETRISLPVEFSSTATVTMDGARLDVLANADIGKSPSSRQTLMFWTTPPRTWNDPNIDVLEIRFSEQRLINHVAADYAHFPHVFEIQFWDDETGQWQVMVTKTVTDSVPYGINGHTPPTAIHPYHYGENHWLHCKERIPATLTNAVRMVIKRFYDPDIAYPTFGSADDSVRAASVCRPPVGLKGLFVMYPCGLRNIDLGYRVESVEDAGRLTSDGAPLAMTRNVLGQPVQHSLQVYAATNTLDNDESYWKCDPQPMSDAVVNFHMDVSDSGGLPVVVDAFEVNPLTIGANVNVYWSDAMPTDLSAAYASDATLPPSRVLGSVHNDSGTYAGLNFPPTDFACVEFDSDLLHWDPEEQTWWGAATLVAKQSAAEMNDAVLLSMGDETFGDHLCGNLAVRFDQGAAVFELEGLRASVPVNFWAGSVVNIIFGMTGTRNARGGLTGEIRLAVAVNGVEQGSDSDSGQITADITPAPRSVGFSLSPSTLRVGAAATVDDVQWDGGDIVGGVFPLRLTGMVLGFGEGPSTESFLSDPTYWYRQPDQNQRREARQGGFWASDHSSGTFLRYSPSYDTEWGFVGGPVDFYSVVSWTPVGRDFALRQGILRIPTTRARFFKFEFSSLNPEPWEPFLTIDRTVKKFRSSVISGPQRSGQPWTDQFTWVVNATGTAKFEDQWTLGTSMVNPEAHSPTTALAAVDDVTGAQIRDAKGYGYNTIPWQPWSDGVQHYLAGVHEYDTVKVEHVNKVGFFVGLRTLKPLRLNPSPPTNHPSYDDYLFDLANVEDGTTFEFDPGALWTIEGGVSSVISEVEAVSALFETIVPVEGVQFSTQQTEPYQVLYDDKFQSPLLATSDFSDTTGWHRLGDSVAIYDTTAKAVKVVRDPEIVLRLLGPQGGIIHDPVQPIMRTSPIWTSGVAAGAYGGLGSATVEVSDQGVLHAAVRVTALNDLTSPLTLRIMGSDSATILASVDFTPPKGVATEQVLRYVLNTMPSVDDIVSVQLIQTGQSEDSWLVHALSLFDDSIFWEWSNDAGITWVPAIDVRNNHEGIVRFARPGTGVKWRVRSYRKNTAVSAVRWKPWYQGRILGRHTFPQRGPNLSTYDDLLPIQDDPGFSTWTNPIPQRWFSAYSKSYAIDTETLYGQATFVTVVSRTAGEDIPVPTDTATVGSIGYNRYNGGGDNPDVADSVATTRSFIRNGGETVTVTDSVSRVVSGGGITRPPVDEVP